MKTRCHEEEEAVVVVRPMVVIGPELACGSERPGLAGLREGSLSGSGLQRLLDESLTRPLGSMFPPRRFELPDLDEEITLVQRRSMHDGRMPAVAAPRIHRARTSARAVDVTARTRLLAPNAPSQSSALRAGVVDGWERLPGKASAMARRRQARMTDSVLGLLGAVLAYGLTWLLMQ